MNQVKFLGLAHTFATVSHIASKTGMDTQVEIIFFFNLREELRNNYQSHNYWSLPFWGINPRAIETCLMAVLSIITILF